MHNYWLVSLSCLAAALAAAFWTARRFRFLRRPAPAHCRAAANTAAVGFALLYGMIGAVKYRGGMYGLWDFGIYDSMMHHLVSGGGFPVDFRGWFDHFSPLTAAAGIGYWVWDAPYTAIFTQSAAMAAGGWVLYKLARHYFGDSAWSLLIAAGYYLNPYYARIVQFDFHIECLFPLLFFGAFLALAKKRTWLFYLLLAAVPLIKEDFVIPLGAAGLFRCFQKNRRISGVLLIAAAGVWTWFVLKIYFPRILGMEYWHYGRYELPGTDWATTCGNARTLLMRALRPESFKVLASVLLPCALLPLGYWKAFVFLLLPVLGIQLISGFDQQALLYSHYASGVLGIAPVAALYGLRELRWRWRRSGVELRRSFAIFAWSCVLLCSFVFTESFTVRYYHYIRHYVPAFHPTVFSLPLRAAPYREFAERYRHARDVEKVARRLPRTWKIVAQNEPGVFFIRHAQVGSLPDNEATTEDRKRDYTGSMWRGENADAWVFDHRLYGGFEATAELNAALKNLLLRKHFVPALVRDGLIVFVRKECLREVNWSGIFTP